MTSNLSQTIDLQQQASDPKNSAWVFASAGSGKTKILTDRVLRLLLDDVSPSKILCLTFTKVAAAEMQSRINSELARWILGDDATLKTRLFSLSGRQPTQLEIKKAQALFIKILDEEAKIKVQTIHSFCQTLIKIFPFEAKVRPTFEVLEVNQEKLLLKRAQNETLKKALTNPELKNLVQQANSRLHEKNFSDLITNLLNKKEQINHLKEQFFGIDNAINEIYKNFSVEKTQTDENIFDDFLSKLNRTQNLNLALQLHQSGSKNNIKIAVKIENFFKEPSLDSFSSYKSALFTDKNESRKISGKIADNMDIINILDESRELIWFFLEESNSLKIANDTALLLRFIDHILENYAHLKAKNSFLDYNDLITETNKLLNNPEFSDWIKLKMDGSFDHILVDESQDTNHQQWNIIKALSEDFFTGMSSSGKDRSIFIVGDEKQSIYSFQGAEPNISAEIFAYFSDKLGDKLKRIELNNSFRSKEIILKAVDAVFSDPQRKSAISKISEFKEHKAIRDGLGKVEIWPQIKKEKEKKEVNYEWDINFSKKEKPTEAEILAKIISQNIKSRVLTSKTDKNPINYSDFMILLRNRTNGFDQALIKFFHQYQIPFSSISNVKFSDSLIIQDLLAAAKFTLLPYDDLNLACLLKSPIFEISEDDLLEICLVKNKSESTIYKVLEQIEKFSNLKTQLDQLIEKSQHLNCFEFFYFLLHEKNHRQNFIARFGHESIGIMDEFTLTIFDLCQNFSPNLQKLLEFIDNLDPKISPSSDNNNCVKISTIHSAKGLQAPITIIPDCCYNFNQLLSAKEEISWLEFDDNKFPIWCRKKEDENLQLKNHRQRKLAEAKEESLRVFYVAMTRAENELYIGGFGNASDPESWYEVARNSVSDANFPTMDEFLETIEVPISNDETPEQENSPIEPTIFRSKPASKIINNQINLPQIKGRLIHKILEIIGKNYSEDKDWLLDLTKQIINKEEFLEKAEKNKIFSDISSFLDSDQPQKLFCGKVNCEIEIAGTLNNKKIIARIDLLIEKTNEILIIDYKSDETLPKTPPESYLKQLNNYSNLIKNLYPNHKISTGIFWTKFLKLELI